MLLPELGWAQLVSMIGRHIFTIRDADRRQWARPKLGAYLEARIATRCDALLTIDT